MNGGAEVEEGGEVEFIYVDVNHPNPMCRVAVPEAFRGSYDRRAYAAMIAEATSAVYRGMGIPSPLVRASNGRGWTAARAATGPGLDAWMGRQAGGTA